MPRSGVERPTTIAPSPWSKPDTSVHRLHPRGGTADKVAVGAGGNRIGELALGGPVASPRTTFAEEKETREPTEPKEANDAKADEELRRRHKRRDQA